MKKILTTIISFLIITSINAQTIIFRENFEGAKQPDGWTQVTSASDGGWRFGSSGYLSSNYFSFNNSTNLAATNDDACNCDKSLDKLITPTIDLTNYTSLHLTFDLYYFASKD